MLWRKLSHGKNIGPGHSKLVILQKTRKISAPAGSHMVRLKSSFQKISKNYKSFTIFGQNWGKSELGSSKKGGRREAQGVKAPKNRRLKEQKNARKFISPTLPRRAPRQSQAATKIGHLGKTQTKTNQGNKRCQDAKNLVLLRNLCFFKKNRPLRGAGLDCNEKKLLWAKTCNQTKRICKHKAEIQEANWNGTVQTGVAEKFSAPAGSL